MGTGIAHRGIAVLLLGAGVNPVQAGDCGSVALSDEALGELVAMPAPRKAARLVLRDAVAASFGQLPGDARGQLLEVLEARLQIAFDAPTVATPRASLQEAARPVCALAAQMAALVPVPDSVVPATFRLSDTPKTAAKPSEDVKTVLEQLAKDAAEAEAKVQTEDGSYRSGLQQLIDVHSGLTDMRYRRARTGIDLEAECLTRTPGAACDVIKKTVIAWCDDLGLVNTARCSDRLFEEIARRHARIDDALSRARALSVDAEQTVKIASIHERFHNQAAEASGVQAGRTASYGLFAGPSFVLEDDGSWKGGSEVLFRQQTEIFDRDSRLCGGVINWCRGFFEASFTTPEAYPREVASSETIGVDPLKGKGRLRISTGLISHWNEWIGYEAGIGLSSPLDDKAKVARVEPRVHLGLHFQTLHGDGMLGQVGIGFAHDRAREFLLGVDNPQTPDVDERTRDTDFNRFYLDATALFPDLKLGEWRLAARLTGDWPVDGNSEAEIRTSILFYYPFSSWLQSYQPKVKTPATP